MDNPNKPDDRVSVTDRLEEANIHTKSQPLSSDHRVTDRLPADASTVEQQVDRPITDRLPEFSVTDRLDEAVTDVLSQASTPSPELMPTLGLKPGALVADRYRIEEGPLGAATGEAEVFRCRDEQTSITVALKLYRYNVAPKTAVLDQLLSLNHPDIVSLKAYDKWAGRFYEVMEFCDGESLMFYMPLTEEELRKYLQEIINGLNYCHDLGIVHRDIKPNNLFFRSPNKQDLVIADFGISSVFESEEKVRKTATFTHLTLDYAAPELLDKHEVSAKTDYYALGITLLHLLTGQSPFQGMTNISIAVTHLRGNIPVPENISEDFQQLIRGLLQIRPESRWGYTQVQSWLNGEEILTDLGAPWREDLYAGKESPYPGYPQARNPYELAAALDQFDVEKQLFRGGDIRRWVFDHFDAHLAERIEEIEENYTDRKRLGVFKLQYVLDPSQPFVISEKSVHTIEDLIQLLRSSEERILLALEDALWGEFIECWIDAAQVTSRSKELVQKIKDIRARVKNKNRRLGIFALLYTLKPSIPLQLVQGIEISHPKELEDVLTNHPALEQIVKEYLYGGQFEEWLRAAFPDRQSDLDFVLNCKKTYEDNQELGSYAFRWHFRPSAPFPFGSEKVASPKELAARIDRDANSTQLGIQLLSKGWIRTWLTTTGKLQDSTPLDQAINQPEASEKRKMEAVLHILDPDLPGPKLSCDQHRLDLGNVSTESSQTVSITLRNAGRGFLSGRIRLSDLKGGFRFATDPPAIEGGPVTVQVSIVPLGLPVRSQQRTTIVAETNGGRLQIPISYKVVAPLAKMIGRSVLAGGIFAICLGLFRVVLQSILPTYTDRTMDWISFDYVSNHSEIWYLIPLAVMLSSVIGGGVYYVARMAQVK